MPYALENIKVVELGGYIVGSYCATLLADMGADVIKVEAMTGDGLRGQLGAFQGWNRGKRGMAIDLHLPEGKAILRKLITRADVLVQNLRQGVAERWEADYPTVSQYNQRLVYLAMPGYGQSGPYIERPAFDPLLQAMSGVMQAQGGDGNPPVYLRAAVTDFAGAMLGAWGVAMALYARVKTGKGQFLHGALLNAAVAVQAAEFIDYEGKQDEPRFGSVGINAVYRMYQAKDGWFFIGCENEAQWQALCKATGKPELVTDKRFTDADARTANMSALSVILEPLFTTGTVRYWLNRLDKAKVPCSRVDYFREMFDNPHLLENGLIAEHESADVGPVKQLGMALKLSGTPGNLQRAAPGLGQHNDEVLTEIGYSPQEITRLREKEVIE
jgi:crotonobetainyl-CoA:carnitine CoA-transferase CaiB-like acyl-CoA transferase